MAAPSSMSDIINRLTGGASGSPEAVWVNKNMARSAGSTISYTSGTWATGWLMDGNVGTAPTTVAAPTSATAGSIPFTNASGGRTKYLLNASLDVNWNECTNVNLVLMDRLLHVGSLSGTVTSAQTVGGSLTRSTAGTGNQIFLEIYSNVGTTATTITASYTNQAGTSGRTTQSIAFGGTGNRETHRLIALPLQDGDTGVQAVASVTLAATTGTAGTFGCIVAKPIFNLVSGGLGMMDGDIGFNLGIPSLPSIENDACLMWAYNANSSSVSATDLRWVHGLLTMVES